MILSKVRILFFSKQLFFHFLQLKSSPKSHRVLDSLYFFQIIENADCVATANFLRLFQVNFELRYRLAPNSTISICYEMFFRSLVDAKADVRTTHHDNRLQRFKRRQFDVVVFVVVEEFDIILI